MTVGERVRYGHDLLTRKPTLAAVAVFLTALAFRLLYFARAVQVWGGARIAGDTASYRYSCKLLAADPVGVLSTTKGLLYFGFTVPFCTVESISGGSGVVWVAVQIVLSSATAVLVYGIGRRLVDTTAGLVAGLGLALLFDVVRYTVFVLSETTFVFVLVLSMWAIVRHRDEPTVTSRAVVLGSLGWLAVTRPFGMPIVLGWLLLELLPAESDYRLGLIPRHLAIVGAIVLPVTILTLSSAPSKFPQIEQGFRGGWILFKGEPEFLLSSYPYTLRPAAGGVEFLLVNIDHVLVMIVLRVGVFFLPLVDVFSSPVWNVVNTVVLGPLLVGSLVGVGRAWRRRDALPLQLLVPPIVVVTGIVAVTYISQGWRFRAPLGPVFALLTGYAVATDGRLAGWLESGDE